MKQIGNMHHSITIEFVKIEKINYSTSFTTFVLVCVSPNSHHTAKKKKLETTVLLL